MHSHYTIKHIVKWSNCQMPFCILFIFHLNLIWLAHVFRITFQPYKRNILSTVFSGVDLQYFTSELIKCFWNIFNFPTLLLHNHLKKLCQYTFWPAITTKTTRAHWKQKLPTNIPNKTYTRAHFSTKETESCLLPLLGT